MPGKGYEIDLPIGSIARGEYVIAIAASHGADQAKTLAEAKKAAKADDFNDALVLVDKVRRSNLRIGDAYEESLALGTDIEDRMSRALDNAGK